MLDPSHYEDRQKHQTAVHRMDCLAGWRLKNKVLGTDFCPVEVARNRSFKKRDHRALHPYKKFQEVYPTWSIPPDKVLCFGNGLLPNFQSP